MSEHETAVTEYEKACGERLEAAIKLARLRRELSEWAIDHGHMPPYFAGDMDELYVKLDSMRRDAARLAEGASEDV